jgi:hypothetical protein
MKTKINIIIPTAKLISEDLQGIGKLPPVIYPSGLMNKIKVSVMEMQH